MKHVYLSAPVTGMNREDVASLFERNTEIAKEAFPGCEVFNPILEVPEDASHELAMSICLGALCGLQAMDGGRVTGSGYDAMLVPLGWQASEGCRTEVQVAFSLGIPVYLIEKRSEQLFELFRLEEA